MLPRGYTIAHDGGNTRNEKGSHHVASHDSFHSPNIQMAHVAECGVELDTQILSFTLLAPDQLCQELLLKLIQIAHWYGRNSVDVIIRILLQ